MLQQPPPLHLVHLSRWAADLIIYSSGQFKFVQCSDAHATGSNLMRQRKNPDALELLRGKDVKQIGNLTGMMAVIKGIPTTYNKRADVACVCFAPNGTGGGQRGEEADSLCLLPIPRQNSQESWKLIFDTVDTTYDCMRIATGMLSTLQIKPDKMLAVLSANLLATDLVEYLVRKGVPLPRDAPHERRGSEAGRGPRLRSIRADLQSIDALFADDVSTVWDFNRSMEMRDTEGGASKRSVMQQVSRRRAYGEE